MMNVCRRCGAYHADKTVDPTGPWAICPECGEHHRFVMAPLLLIGGPSGGGKTTVLQALIPEMPEVVLLEGDILWRPEFSTPGDGYHSFYDTWLRLLKNIAQSGRPAVLVSAGSVVPENIEGCVERRYFSFVRYLALTAEDEVLESRLAARAAWRRSSAEEFVTRQIEFSRWLRAEAHKSSSPITLVDTTHQSVEDAAVAVRSWILDQLGEREDER